MDQDTGRKNLAHTHTLITFNKSMHILLQNHTGLNRPGLHECWVAAWVMWTKALPTLAIDFSHKSHNAHIPMLSWWQHMELGMGEGMWGLQSVGNNGADMLQICCNA